MLRPSALRFKNLRVHAHVLVLVLTACGGEKDASPAPAETAPAATDDAPAPVAAEQPAEAPPAPEVDPSAPASKRMLGTWTMKLDEVSPSALTPDLLKAKRQGLTKMVGFEYQIDESKFDVVQTTPRGVVRKSFYYEVVKENGDELDLSRKGEDGLIHFVRVVVTGDELRIGTGKDEVLLHRAEPK